MRGDDALGVAGAASPDVLVVLARGEERRHGIDVGGERDDQRLAPLGEDVEAPRLDFDALDAAAVARGERRQVVVEIVADAFFVVGDRFDIDQRAREFEDVHKMSERGGGEREGKYARADARVFIPDSAPPA